jgi:hypothetical protein
VSGSCEIMQFRPVWHRVTCCKHVVGTAPLANVLQLPVPFCSVLLVSRLCDPHPHYHGLTLYGFPQPPLSKSRFSLGKPRSPRTQTSYFVDYQRNRPPTSSGFITSPATIPTEPESCLSSDPPTSNSKLPGVTVPAHAALRPPRVRQVPLRTPSRTAVSSAP